MISFGPWTEAEERDRHVQRIAVPVGLRCMCCGAAFQDDEIGLVIPFSTDEGSGSCGYHRSCFMRMVFGEQPEREEEETTMSQPQALICMGMSIAIGLGAKGLSLQQIEVLSVSRDALELIIQKVVDHVGDVTGDDFQSLLLQLEAMAPPLAG